jgi:hypothetical protein
MSLNLAARSGDGVEVVRFNRDTINVTGLLLIRPLRAACRLQQPASGEQAA